MNIATINQRRILLSPPPRGEIIWSSNTNTTWVVPDNVTSVSAVLIDAGTDGSTYTGGAGGNLRYITSLAVTPGETLTVSIGGATSLKRGATTLLAYNSSISGSIGGGNGGGGGTYYSTSSTPCGNVYGTGGGGDAGNYSANGGTAPKGASGYAGPVGTAPHNFYYGYAGWNGDGRSLFGSSASGGSFGGGGGGGWRYTYCDTGAAGSNGGDGGQAAMRIVWGEGRAYPDTDVDTQI
jgi:hypothetical protein